MKRLICLMLALLLLTGCSITGERIKDPVTFYYVRGDYRKNMESVIVSEEREAAGHMDDLPYLLALYSMGPSTDGLKSPFPKNTRIIPTEHTAAGIVLSLSEIPESMTDAEFTLAGACLALTCMELTDVPQVTVLCGDRSLTIREDNLLLYSSADQELEEETK